MHLLIRARGFTLAELVVTLAVASIVAGLASVSWTNIVTSTGHTDVVMEARQMFALARSYAVSQRTLTTLCPLTAAMECTDNWNNPVSIFPDKDNDKRPDSSRIYKVFNLSKGHSELYSRTAGRGYFQLSANGMSHGTMGSLVICSSAGRRGIDMSYMALNIGGRLRVLHDDDGDGAIKLPWGTNLTCPGS